MFTLIVITQKEGHDVFHKYEVDYCPLSSYESVIEDLSDKIDGLPGTILDYLSSTTMFKNYEGHNFS